MTVFPLSMDRVIASLGRRGLTATQIGVQPSVAIAPVEDVTATYVIIGRHLIVRIDVSHQVDALTDPVLAGWLLAANDFNMLEELATAAIIEAPNKITARLEVEFDCASGITDDQLDVLTTVGTDAVVAAAVAIEHIHNAVSLTTRVSRLLDSRL